MFLGCVVCGDFFGALFEPWDEITVSDEIHYLENISPTSSQHLFSQDSLNCLWFADSTGVVFGAVYGIQHPYNHEGSCQDNTCLQLTMIQSHLPSTRFVNCLNEEVLFSSHVFFWRTGSRWVQETPLWFGTLLDENDLHWGSGPNPVTVGKSIHFHEANPMDLPYPLWRSV